MATLTISMGAETASATIPGADVTRILAMYKARYGQIQDGVDGEGNPIMRDRTNAEIFRAFATGFFNGVSANVYAYEKEQATQAAVAGVIPINITPN